MLLWLVFPPVFVVALVPSHPVGRWTIPAALPILLGCLAACLLWQRTLTSGVARVPGVAGVLAFLLPAIPSARIAPAALHSLLSSAAIAAMMAFVVCSPRSLVVKLPNCAR